jgi:2'-5' RNA ligase
LGQAKEGLHVTLAFLGELDKEGLAELLRATRVAVRMAASRGIRGPFQLSTAGLRTFPPRGKASVIAAAIGEGTAEATVLAAMIEEALERMGRETGKRFRPL